jgi:hypothetical protein
VSSVKRPGAARKSGPWGARLASQKRPEKPQSMKAAPQTIVAGRMIRFYIGQNLSKTVPSTQMAARRYEIWMSHHWKKMAPLALHVPYEMQIVDVDLLTYLPQERNVESDPQVLALPDLAPSDPRNGEFNLNPA